MDTSIDAKVRENRLRRMAQRQGLVLNKARLRDPRAIGYGGYWLVDPNRSSIVAGSGPNSAPVWHLDDIEEWLTHGTLASDGRSLLSGKQQEPSGA